MLNRAPTEKIRLNLTIDGRRTSFSLEVGVWDAITEMCRYQSTSLDELCEEIIANAGDTSMASALRLAVLAHFRERCAAASAEGDRLSSPRPATGKRRDEDK